MSKICPIVAWAILSLGGMTALARDRGAFRGDDVPSPPPEPNAMEIEVPRGGPVWITLSAYSLTSPIIRYRIRRQPKDGRLGTPQMVTVDTGRVKYTPPAGAGPGEDSFAFEVQSGAGVSAPAEVHIKITDTDPQLVAPDEIDFGSVLSGGTSRRLLVLQNIGGGLATGTVRVPEGWRVDGDAAYSLGAGAKQSFALIFKPREQREYTGDVEYTGDLDRATDLKGKQVAPISVTPGPVELTEGGNMRIGTIEVENRTDTARTVRVTPGPQLETDATLSVPPNGTAEIAVRAKPGELGRIDDHVTVEGEDLKADVPVHAGVTQEMMRRQLAAVSAQSPAALPTQPAQAAPVPVSAPASPAAPGLPAMNLQPLVADIGDSMPTDTGTPFMALRVESVGKNEAVVTCDFKSAGPVHSYRLEAQTLALVAPGRAVAKWVPVTNADISVTGASVSAQLNRLLPNGLYVVRLVGTDAQGRIIAMSGAGQVWTAHVTGRKPWGWIALGVAALAAAVAWWKKKRRYRTD